MTYQSSLHHPEHKGEPGGGREGERERAAAQRKFMTAINLPHADPAPRLLSVRSQKRRTIFNIFRILAEFVICTKKAPYDC